ncbi:hypothetical protein M2165_001434 [Variovorax sp. TBS-050B]|uniref:hypothetical protein n=1 Tax=Variovorax sp. TBS-050B TaxID=2940551 RepID=UPI0024764B04|nr:hypothetical protein [Variovorax sp. TBS-050B]MDH6591545.1 hypothetical protein [Variovorax sp. TBS-050B]
MHLPRNHTRLPGLFGRWVLLWFVLSIGAAAASPIVHPQAVELVCASAGAVKVVVQTDDGLEELGASHLDCPLCLLTGAPPPAPAASSFEHPLPTGRVARPIPAVHFATASAAPLPARGPPALFRAVRPV